MGTIRNISPVVKPVGQPIEGRPVEGAVSGASPARLDQFAPAGRPSPASYNAPINAMRFGKTPPLNRVEAAFDGALETVGGLNSSDARGRFVAGDFTKTLRAVI